MRGAVLCMSVAAICLLAAACGDLDERTPARETLAESGADASSGEGTCDAAIVETTLPGQHGTDVVALCKACDHGCDDAGDPCSRYGDSCDLRGARGVCAACCDGERGSLRCHPID
jgi:hypothetical protein